MKKGKIFRKILCTQLIVISILANSCSSSISYAESDSLSKLGEDIVADIKEKGSSVVYHWTKKGFENHEVKKYG